MTKKERDLVAGADEGLAISLQENVTEFRRRRECGKYLAQLRKEAVEPHDQKQLAKALEVSPAFISHIESGKAALPPRLIHSFIRALQIRDAAQLAWQLLYAYYSYLFDALFLPVASISDIKAIEICRFDDLFQLHDLSQRKQDRPLVILGDFLRLRRQNLGAEYTQDAVRGMIGYRNRTALSNIEMGWAKITSEYFSSWANALQLPPDKFAAILLYFYEPILYDLISAYETDRATVFNNEEIEKLRGMTTAFVRPETVKQVKVDIQSDRNTEWALIAFDFVAGQGTLIVEKSLETGRPSYTVSDKDGNELCRGTSVDEIIARMSKQSGMRGQDVRHDTASACRHLRQTGVPELQIRDGLLHKMGKTRTS
jgi:transcriptional regulator with XRE-family HTH domain